MFYNEELEYLDIDTIKFQDISIDKNILTLGDKSYIYDDPFMLKHDHDIIKAKRLMKFQEIVEVSVLPCREGINPREVFSGYITSIDIDNFCVFVSVQDDNFDVYEVDVDQIVPEGDFQ